MRKIHGYYRLHFCDWSHSCVWDSIIFLFHYPSLIPFLLSQHLYWLWFFVQWDDPYFQGSVLLVTLMALDYCSFSLSFVTGHRSTKKVRESPGFLTYILPCVVGTLFFLDNEDRSWSLFEWVNLAVPFISQAAMQVSQSFYDLVSSSRRWEWKSTTS